MCHEVTSGFFAPNAPNPLHWTLNSCFGALHSVWVHLGLFRNCMKLDAKQSELVQLKQSELMLGTHVWVHLGSFRNRMKLDAKQGELVQLMRKLVPRSHGGIFLYERTQSTPLDPKLMFWCVALRLGAFGIVS